MEITRRIRLKESLKWLSLLRGLLVGAAQTATEIE